MAMPSRQALQQSGQRFRSTFNPRRNDAARNHTRLEQAQVVARKIEDLGNGRNVGGSPQIHAGEAQDRFIDDAKPGLDRRPGLGKSLALATDREVDGDVDNARAFGEIHA